MPETVVNSRCERGRATMRHDPDTAPGRRGLRVLKWTERLLLIAGAVTLAWCAGLVVQTYLVQRLARASLRNMPRIDTPASPRPRATRGTPLAALSIPRVNLSAVVLMGSDPETSVVRPDFRHHDVKGLYVADSSVFPTNLGVNPQIVIMAMAARCADGVARV